MNGCSAAQILRCDGIAKGGQNMTHRTGQLSPEESLLVTNPKQFLDTNILIPKRPMAITKTVLLTITYFKLEPARDYNGPIDGKVKNRKGASIPAWDLTEDINNGPIHAYYLHWVLDGVAPANLGVQTTDPDFFVTAALNGCSFSFDQGGSGAAAAVAHHNSKQDGGDQTTILSQPHSPGATFFHQDDYRKSHGVFNKTLDSSYEGTLVGNRDNTNIWRFFLQSRKGLAIKDQSSTTWRMKGVTECNP